MHIEVDDPWFSYIPNELDPKIGYRHKQTVYFGIMEGEPKMAEKFKYPIVDTTMEFVNGFVMLKNLYKDDPVESTGASVYLKDGWYLKINKIGQISLMNDSDGYEGMVSGEATFFDKHPSTMALILRDYLAELLD